MRRRFAEYRGDVARGGHVLDQLTGLAARQVNGDQMPVRSDVAAHGAHQAGPQGLVARCDVHRDAARHHRQQVGRNRGCRHAQAPKRLRVSAKRDPEGAHRVADQHQRAAQRMRRPLVHEHRPHQLHRVGQRQPVRHHAHRRRQLLARKEDARQEHHWREEQREVVGEEIIALGQRIEDQGDAGERDANAQQHRPGHQQLGAVADAQAQHHAQDGGDREHAP